MNPSNSANGKALSALSVVAAMDHASFIDQQ